MSVAQSTSSGTITGTVTDHTGAAIPNATVTVVDTASKAERTATTNKDGQYVVPDVAPGTYDVTAIFAGFSKDVTHGLAVNVNAQSTANFTLAVGSETTTIEVQATTADLQTLNASTSETVDPAMTDSLPAINRDASQFASFMPGVTPNGNVAGTVSDQAVFQLDGGNDSSDMDGSMLSYTGSNGGSSAGGSSSGTGVFGASSSGVMPMPQDSVEEVRVSTSGQTADFNNSSGMQASVVTKRGHDHWHGTVYEYYLDSNIGGNTWQNNFPNSTALGTSYTPKPSYHFSRFGAAAGGPLTPEFWGGKTYIFANYEGFRYPLAATYERTVPSYNFLQQGQLSFGASTYSAAALKTADPRAIGFDQTLQNFYNTQLPVAPASNNGSTGNNGAAYGGVFDTSCGSLSTSYCDGVNTIGFKGNVLTPQTSNFFATRVDHNFGAKWQLMLSFRYYKFVTTTSNQVDIGGGFTGDKVGYPVATAPRPQDPIYLVAGLTTNISSSLTNDAHFSFLRNYWQWKNNGDIPQINGAPGVVEPFGENSATTVLSPYNVNSQNTRTRIWDGKDNFFRDDITKLKGDHLIQFGGQYQHNTIYHQRTDNGNAINYSLTYQIGDASGGGNIAYSALGSLIPSSYSTSNAERFMDSYYGFVTDTQVANTYSNSGGNLTLNPPFTPFSAKSKVPYYNLYATDTWHAKPSLTVNYGLGYAIEMPPVEQNGNQVMFTDQVGNPIHVSQYLATKEQSSLQGIVYNPIIGFSLVHNAVYGPGNSKYPYSPFFGAISPRISFSWSPDYKDGVLGKIFGSNATVVRAGYGRIYGRINGDIQVLNPILSPGLVLATQCRYAQSSTTGAGGCTQSNYTDTTAFRFGTAAGLDGLTAPLAAAPAKLSTPVYRPGVDGPGVAIASPVDPTYRPNDVDTFNLSIQRQLTHKTLIEVGYIGRLIHNELETLNPNAVPYMLTLGGQSFESAYLAVESAFGCTTSASLCSVTAGKAGTKTTSVNPTVAAQPFFEAALGGVNSAYCTGYSSCTAAVVAKQASNLGSQKIYSLWSALDNNTNGTASGGGFVFARSMMGTALSGTYGSAGQMGTGLSVATSTGYGNYNGGYVSFKMSDWRGLTLQENLTYSKAMGLDDSAQSSSGLVASDSFNLHQSYGVQSYNQKIIFNTFVVYEPPYYKDQRGVAGHLLGGWTISPVLTAGTGEPLTCTTNSSYQSYGGTDGSNFTDNEQCVFNTPYTGGYHTHRGVTGGTDPLGIAVGTAVHAGGSSAAVNMFSNPVAVWDTVRPPILGLDFHDSGNGPIAGLGYLDLDASIKKKLVVWESGSMEFTGVLLNAMNHNDFANPTVSLGSSSSFGVVKTQGNSPREIQMGIRANF
jgi:hypothetical protein